jgi:hypothetical protein
MKLELFRALAALTDLIHVAFMLLWGLGLPLLFWQRFPKLSRAYMWFTLAFVSVTVASHAALGECFLTTLARELWTRGAGFREHAPFTVLVTDWVAGVRPDSREAVLIWELAVFASSAGCLWYWHRTGRRFALHLPHSLASGQKSRETGIATRTLDAPRAPRIGAAGIGPPDGLRRRGLGDGARPERGDAVLARKRRDP